MNARGTQFAWQVHAALETWTARADGKASILLALQSGAFVFAVSARQGLFGSATWRSAATLGLLLLAMIAAAAAILPALGSPRRQRDERHAHLIYFGHLRYWRPDALAAELDRLTPEREVQMLSAQMIAMSRLNWRKHRLLQVSIAISLAAVLTLAAGALALAGKTG